jgi:hypothetical protein
MEPYIDNEIAARLIKMVRSWASQELKVNFLYAVPFNLVWCEVKQYFCPETNILGVTSFSKNLVLVVVIEGSLHNSQFGA